MAGLSADEAEKTQHFTKLVNELRLQDGDGKLISPNAAQKFMMARKFDVQRALVLYQAHEVTRFRENLIDIDPKCDLLQNELQTAKFTVLPTRDANGAAIVMFTVYKHSPLNARHDITLRGMVYQLDIALEDIRTQRSGIVFIYNMTGSKYSNFDYELSQKILALLKGSYPARLKKVLIVMAPLWFKAPFKILRLFVREKLRDRVLMITTAQLPAHIPPGALPAELGGLLKHDHSKWLRQCEQIFEETKDPGGLGHLAFYKKLALEAGAGSTSSPIAILTGNLSHSNVSLSAGNQSSDEESSTSSETAPTEGKGIVVVSPEDAVSSGRKTNKPKPEKIKMPTTAAVTSNENGSKQVTHMDLLSLGAPEDEEEDNSSNEFLHSSADPGLSLEEFIQYMNAKGRKGLYDEYNVIKSKPLEGTFECSRLRENQLKNRYTDVLCYDHSRVRLPSHQMDGGDDSEETDYINANYVDGYMQKKAFISTQGPLVHTIKDLWRVVWVEQTVVIVMTTRTIERCRQKCAQYYPLEENSEEDYGGIKVRNMGSEILPDYVTTRLLLTDENGKVREVSHLLFNSWPDYGVPHSAIAMLDFRQKVRDCQKIGVERLGAEWAGHPNGPPIIVHCSAGIGRTGTFITLDISLMRLQETGKVNIKRTVEKLRGQRAYSIQMPDQYVFCYLALLEYLLTRGLLQDVDLSGFDDSESDVEE